MHCQGVGRAPQSACGHGVGKARRGDGSQVFEMQATAGLHCHLGFQCPLLKERGFSWTASELSHLSPRTCPTFPGYLVAQATLQPWDSSGS